MGVADRLVEVARAIGAGAGAMRDGYRGRLGIDPPKAIAATPRTGQTYKRFRNVDTYNSHPAMGITIENVISAFRAAERGEPCRQFDLFDDLVENDGHLSGLIEGRILSVSGKPWTLQSGRPGDAGSERAAADLSEILANDIGFRDFLEHQLTAPFYGFAVSEIVWDRIDGKILPVRFVNAAHRRFAAPTQMRADEIWLIGGDTQAELTALDPGYWAITRRRHRNPWAAGNLRTATWWAVFKRWSVRDWQVFADKFGLPLSVGYYEESASPASREALEDALKGLGEDGYAILSDMTELMIKDAVRSGDATSVYPAIVALCEAQMSKLISGATLTTDVGGTGSYALGAVHETRGFNLAVADATRVAEMFVRDVGRPFVAWNGYGNAAPPRLVIQVIREMSPEIRAKVISIMANEVGLEIDADQCYEELSLRRPAAGKGLKGTARVIAEKPAPAAAPGKGPPS